MNSTTPTLEKPRELAHREHDGVEVTLLWHPADNHLSVVVVDRTNDAAFELVVDPDEAMDVFEHPYAYAAFGGVEYEVRTREPVEV